MDFTNQVPAIYNLLTDENMSVFRYGLERYSNTSDSIEDPTFLGFTIEIDESTPLFTQARLFIEKHSQENTEIAARLPLYEEFVANVVKIFKSQDSASDGNSKNTYIKQHYINSVSGLDLLTKKTVAHKEDKLSIELYEDLTMFTTYLSNLYNNLVYSYENQRVLIPENLLHFNLYVKISEIRNFTSLSALKNNDYALLNALKNNVTNVTFKLWDCTFDFFGSLPIPNEIAQSGIAQSGVPPSISKLDVFYSSVSRTFYNPLIKNAIFIDTSKIDLGTIIVGYDGNLSTTTSNSNAQSSIINTVSPPQKASVKQTINPQQREAFANTIRRPSSPLFDQKEIQQNSELANKDAWLDYDAELIKMRRYNEVLAPTDLANPNLEDLSLKENLGTDKTSLFDPNGLKALAKKVVSKTEHGILDEINILKEKAREFKNQLVKDFIYDLNQKIGIKTIIPANVYTDNSVNLTNVLQDTADIIKSNTIGTITGSIQDAGLNLF